MYSSVKRVFDIVTATTVLVVTSPIIMVSCAAIIAEDKENPIFAQERIGKDEKPFVMYKLRTMKTNAEDELDNVMHMNEMDGPVFKIKDDPRVTNVGKFLRKSCIDELPQLWNVIKGDMSLVGPRPPLPREVEQYGDLEKERLSVKPGMTCYWQVADNRNDISFDEWMEMDHKYIRDMSVMTDLKILFRTAGAVLKMSGR